MKVLLPQEIGFCFGVRRALRLVEEELEKGGRIYALGDLIHNFRVVESLARRGVESVSDLSQVKEGTVIIRSHGVDPSLIEDAREMGLKVVNTTCPYVLKVQRIARFLSRESYLVVVIGLSEHPEVKGVIANVKKGKACVINSPEEAEKISFAKKMGVVVQTTQRLDNFRNIVKNLVNKAEECRVFNTICRVIIKRQKEVKELAKKVETMIVVGGYKSSNTRQLAQMCRVLGVSTYFIERKEDLQLKELEDVERIGVIGGTSTPREAIEEIRNELLSIK